MAVERELHRLLERALLSDATEARTTGKDGAQPQREPAREILAKLQTAFRQTLLPLVGTSADVNLPELLVLVAEAAVHQQDFDTARRAIDWFLDDCSAKNQFYCRAQFVRAHCASHDAANNTGAARLRRVLDALRFVLLVLPVACDACKRPAYDFLVYNASVTYWRIARQLMKRTTWQFLAPSLAKIIEALRAVGERDVLWVARLQLALVSAQLDAKQFAEAAKTVNDLVDVQLAPLLMAGGNDAAGNDSSRAVRELFEAALRAQVHVGTMKDTECQKIVPKVKKSAVVATSRRAALLVKLQCVRSGGAAATVDGAYSEIFQDITGFAAFSRATTADELAQFLHSLDAKSIDAIDAEVIADMGLHAVFNHELGIARCCDAVLLRKGKSLLPRLRVLHQMLKAALQVFLPPATHNWGDDAGKRQSIVLARRVEAMKVVERAMLAAKRQDDAELIESVCVYAWNLSLPLLQPHSRSCLTRVFTLAASVLEDVDSLLLVLRVRLLLEIAKLEVASEFLSKAYESVNKALAFDYGVALAHAASIDDVQAHESKITTRPVDLHLVALKKKLEWRLDMAAADGAESPEYRIQALVEQAREGKDSSALHSALTQAVAALSERVDQRAPPERLVTLWFDVCKLMREKLQDAPMAERFAKRALEMFFPSATIGASPSVYEFTPESPLRTEKSLMVLEIEFRTLLVEVLAARIKSRAAQLAAAKSHVDAVRHGSRRYAQRRDASEIELAALKRLSSETFILGMDHAQQVETSAAATSTDAITSDSDSSEAIYESMATIKADALAMKKELIEHLTVSLTAAGRIGWRFALENTCVYLWNYHFHLFRALVAPTRASRVFAVQNVLPECIAAFEAAYTALEVLAGVDLELLACIALGLGAVYEKQARWDRVLAIADAFLKRKPSGEATASARATAVSAVHLMRFAEMKTRAQLAQSAKEISPGETASAFLKVAALLEMLEASLLQLPHTGGGVQSIEKSQVLYQKVVALWQTIANDMVAPLLHASAGGGAVALTMDEVQHQVEIYVELWTRTGYAALRMQQFRFVVECTTQALAVLPTGAATNRRKASFSSSSTPAAASLPPLTTSAWRWLAASEVLCARAILALGNGDKTPKSLVLAALQHLVHASECSERANAASLVVTACEVAWNAALIVLTSINSPETSEYDAADLQRVIGDLRAMLCALSAACVMPAPGDDANQTNWHHCYGDLVLLTLAVCEKAEQWTESCGVCGDVFASRAASSVPPETLNEICTAAAISSAKLGKLSAGASGGAKPSGAGGRKSDGQSALLKAKILKKIAFSSVKDPPAQLKALASAFTELDGKLEEQAVLLIDMAEWFYTTRISPQDMDTHLDSAVKILLATEMKDASVTASGVCSPLMYSHAGLLPSVSASAIKHDSDVLTYSPLWRNEKLIRIFAMRAMAASSCAERWSHVERALHCVHRAWENVITIANTAVLQEAFTRLTGSTELDADEWQRVQPPPYRLPQSSEQWLALYLQFAKTTDARFYMEWVPKLQAIQNASIAHFTDPVVTGFYLEKLLTMLHEELADELALPVICLYQVIYFAYSPQRARTMELWLELTLFRVLERLHVAACALPMQSALEIFQTHGKMIVDELHAESGGKLSSIGVVNKGVRRPVLASTSINLRAKMQRCVALFTRLGYVRQAKTALEMLRKLSHASDVETVSELCALTASVLEIEGSASAAAAEITRALDLPLSLDLDKLLRWTERFCEFCSSHDERLARLRSAEKVLARWLISPSLGARAAGELDVLLGIARLKFRRAIVLLEDAEDCDTQSNTSAVAADSVALSLQALSECEQLLTHGGASATLSQFLVQHAQRLLSRYGRDAAHHSTSDVAVAKHNIERAVAAMSDIRARVRQFYTWRSELAVGAVSESPETSPTAAPLEMSLVLAKLLLARIELDAECSATAVREHEMTWYAYESDSRRTVVEKWLLETSQAIARAPGGDLGVAMTLSSSAHALLSRLEGVLPEHVAMAALQVLQCQRLALCHSDDRRCSVRVRERLWTRFTSADSPHVTWICCANNGSAAATPAAADSERSGDSAAAQEHTESERVATLFSNYARDVQSFVKIALERRDVVLVRVCALELIQLYGCEHPLECIRSLLLYQSAAARDHLQSLFARCVGCYDVQQLHLRRMHALQHAHAHAARHSLPFQLSQLFLEQQSNAFKRMAVAVPAETALAALPPHVRVLSLQLAPDRCFLYCAVAGSSEKAYAMARMECTDATLSLLAHTRERVHRWRAASAALLANFEEHHAQDADFEFAATDSLVALSLSTAHDELEKEFSAIIDDTVELLAPLFAHSALLSVLRSELPGAALTLLVDRELEYLPLEALPVLERAESIARDFSLHVLFQRLQAQKAQPLRRDDVRVIVDPFHDDAGLEAQTMESVLQQHTKRPGAAFANWKDAVEHGQPPTPTDWQHALLNRRSGGLVYVGANRVLGSVLSARELLAMSTALNCHVVCLLDRAENTASARRQSKVDSEKAARELALERDAYANAALWSLAGVNVLVMNQWVTTFNANRRLASGLLSGLAKGFSLGKALKKYGELVSPSGAVQTASPSATSSATNSAASLPSGSLSKNGSSAALPTEDEATSGNSNSGGAKIHNASSKLLHEQPDDGVVAVAATAAAGAKGVGGGGKRRLKHRVRFNTVVYGLAHVALKSAE